MSTNFGLNLGAVYIANKDLSTDAVPVIFAQPITVKADNDTPLNVTLNNSVKLDPHNNTVTFDRTQPITVQADSKTPLNVTLNNPSVQLDPLSNTVKLDTGSNTVKLDSNSDNNRVKVDGVVTVSLQSGGNTITGPSSLIAGAKLNATNNVGLDSPENLTSITNKPVNSDANNVVHSLATTQITQTKNIVVLGATINNDYNGDATATASFKPQNQYIINMIDDDTAVKYNRINLMGQLTAFSTESPLNIYKPNASLSTIKNVGEKYETNIYIWYSNDKQNWFKTSLGTIRFGEGTVHDVTMYSNATGGVDGTVTGTGTVVNDTLSEPIQFSRDWETAARYVALTFDTNFTGTVLCSLSQ